MENELWTVWMKVPGYKNGKSPWTRLFEGTQDECEWVADGLLFEARVMPLYLKETD